MAGAHAANPATTLLGALIPLDKVCGHLLRRLEPDRRPKRLAGPPAPTGPGPGTLRIYNRIPVTKKAREDRAGERSQASRRVD